MRHRQLQTLLARLARNAGRLPGGGCGSVAVTAHTVPHEPLPRISSFFSGANSHLLSSIRGEAAHLDSVISERVRCIEPGCRHLHASSRNHAEQDDTPSPVQQHDSGARKNLYIMFTCTVCETRSMKGMSRKSYEEGVVIVQCPGCENRHLIADHLGWFQDGSFTVEDLMAERGEAVIRGVDGTLELTAEDIAGRSKMEEIVQATQPKETTSSSDVAGDAPSDNNQRAANKVPIGRISGS
mmetsp:Transcript_4157/g.8548  ORF Transcript_4157/g.8548 Transcript_4157/m.8548 type:complete len:240 (-) Transcript_4157:484-1203(-)